LAWWMDWVWPRRRLRKSEVVGREWFICFYLWIFLWWSMSLHSLPMW
jgi:hypothetical protein